MEQLIIIGSGPAGHSAAIYAARANLNPLMFEGFLAGGVAAGGQLTTTTTVENYPGFEEIEGTELMNRMRAQSLKCGTRIFTKTVDRVDLSQRPFRVFVGNDTYETKSIIIATGAIAKRLGVKGEELFWQKGISACAVCDGALPFFRNKPLVVVGGGDTAIEEASYLTKFASHVHLLVRRDQLRASKAMQERAFSNEKITIHRNSEAIEALGDNFLSHVKVLNNQTNEETLFEASGLFYAIGHTPNTTFLGGQVEIDESGYIVTHEGTKTSVDGVFAAGDVQDHVYRQAITSAGTGCMAALDAERWLSSN